MKILLISGASGSGKSSVAYELCQQFPNYHLVKSYTDRPQRRREFDHIFISKKTMDYIPMKKIVAFTKIGDYRYCSLYDQFVEDKINVYVVDAYGVRDTLRAFPKAQIVSVLVERENIYIDNIRKDRNIRLPSYDDVTCVINNDATIDQAAYTLDTLCKMHDGFIFEQTNHQQMI